MVAVLATYRPIGNNYGFALYVLSWRHGFVKRGLIGQMFSGAAFLSRGQLMLIEIVFIAFAYAMTHVVFRRVLFESEQDRMFAAMCLAAPGLVAAHSSAGGSQDIERRDTLIEMAR